MKRKARPGQPGYKPQSRPQPRPHTPETHEVQQSEKVGYDELFSLLGVSEDAMTEDPETLLQVLMYRNVNVARTETAPSREELEVDALLTARAIQGALDWYAELGFDIANDRNALSGASHNRKKQFVLRDLATLMNEYPTYQTNDQLVALGVINLFDIMMGNDKLVDNANVYEDMMFDDETGGFSEAVHLQIADAPEEIDLDAYQRYTRFKLRMYKRFSVNPSDFKNKTHAELVKINSPQMRRFVEAETQDYESLWESVQEDELKSDQNEQIDFFAGQEVDFSILPPGTDIREYAEEIISGLNANERCSVDLKRVETLEKIRDELGRERCYYVHGKATGKQAIDEFGRSINEDYIGLVIQDHDNEGQVKGEDAIAISPIAKKHAAYLFRYEATAGQTWRGVLSQPKSESRRLGARPLKFTEVSGRDKYDAFVEKSLELFTCKADHFGSQYVLHRNAKGEYVMRKKPERSLGEVALALAQNDII